MLFQYVMELKINEMPDYETILSIFNDGLPVKLNPEAPFEWEKSKQ